MISHKIVVDMAKLNEMIPRLIKKLANDTAMKVAFLDTLGLTEYEIGMILIDKMMITPQGDIVEHAKENVEAMTTSWGNK